MMTTKMPLDPGDVLGNRYTITRVHRLSGMGALYEARQVDSPNNTGRTFAVKSSVLQDTEEFLLIDTINEFRRLAEILLKVDHPAIPRTFDYFIEEGRTFLITDFVHGEDLETIINRQAERLTVRQVVQWSLMLGDALSYLHTLEPDPIIFRDLKPANVMVNEQGGLFLVDFGIAVVFSNTRVYPPLGTDGYAAPEQYVGDVFPLIDVYGLGATLHHLLTRTDPRLEPPFSFDQRPIHRYNPAVPEALEEIVMKAVSYNSWDRFPSVAQMLEALREIDRSLP